MKKTHGIYLKLMRNAARMTQKDLAKKSGVSLRMIQYYEQGYKDINRASFETVCKLANALHCDAEDLLI